MGSIDLGDFDLNGKTFIGEFLANQERIAEELAQAKRGTMGEEDRAKLIKSIERNRNPFQFEMQVYFFDPKSRLFIAKCNDHFGPSGIVGRFGKNPYPQNSSIRGHHVSFKKEYLTDQFEIRGGMHNFHWIFRTYEYSGEMDERWKVQNGLYIPPNGTANSGGTWKMELNGQPKT